MCSSFDYFDWVSSQSENDIEGKQESDPVKGDANENLENVEHNTNTTNCTTGNSTTEHNRIGQVPPEEREGIKNLQL